MINEEELSYKRGDLVEFKIRLGGGPRCGRGVVLNTAVLYGRAARQIWVLDMDDATPEMNARWTNTKIIVPEGDVVVLSHHDQQSSENGHPAKHGKETSSFLLPRFPDFLSR